MRKLMWCFLIPFILLLAGTVEAQSDTIPPNVDWTRPALGETLYFAGSSWWGGAAVPDSTFWVSFFDPSPSYGINWESLEIAIRECGGETWHDPDTFYTLHSFEYGDANGSLNALGLLHGHCYEMCAWITDNGTNEGHGCVTFYTAATPDTCPPIVIEWQPTGLDCIPVDANLGIVVCDDGLSCETVSGVDPATALISLQVGPSTPMDITSQCTFNSGAMHCIEIEWFNAPPVFPPDVDIRLCIEINDSIGNHMPLDCYTFHTCPEIDTCPPVVTFHHPMDGETLVFDDPYWISHDEFGYPDTNWTVEFGEFTCPGTGLDTTSLEILFGICGGPLSAIYPTGEYYGWDYGSALGPFQNLELEFEQCYVLCASIADNEGNVGENCVEFFTPSMPPPPDTCSPFISEWCIDEGDTLCPPSEDLWFIITDPYGELCSCSGISFGEVTIRNNGVNYYLTETSGLGRIEIDSCVTRFILDTGYYSLIPGTWATLIAHAYDGAGRMVWDSVSFFICEPEDTCPPMAFFDSPPNGDTLFFDGERWLSSMGDSIWQVTFEEYSCPPSGLDSTTIDIAFHFCGETGWYLADYILHTWYDNYGVVQGHFNWMELEPNQCYEICADVHDMAGNGGGECITFYTGDAPVDSCPPYVDHWYPPNDSCIPHDVAQLRALVCENMECIASYINLASITATVAIDSGMPEDITEYLTLDEAEECVHIIWHPSGAAPLPPGTFVMMCIRVEDNAENVLEDCYSWNVCPAPIDSCPPEVMYWEPMPGAIDVDSFASVRAAYLHDPETPGCVFSGVDTSTISMLIIIGDDTIDVSEELEIWGTYDLDIWWHHPEHPLPPGAEVTACLNAADFSGNWMHDCTYFTVAGEAPEDSCPPEVYINSPAHGETLWFDAGSWWHGDTIYGDSTWAISFSEFGCPGTGLDTTSLEISFKMCDDSVWHSVESYNTYWGIDYGNSYGSLNSFELMHNHCYELCAEISDGAGNRGGNCTVFFTGGGPEDTCPPIVDHWWPPSEYCLPVDSHIGVEICEDPACPMSGINMDSITVLVGNSGAAMDDITEECILDTIEHCVIIVWEHEEFSFPPDTTILVCVRAVDNANNVLEACEDWVTCPAIEDICPPVAAVELPSLDSCLPSDSALIIVDVWDPSDDTLCHIATGIDTSTLAVTAEIAGVAEDITAECNIYSLFTGYRIEWYAFGLMPGDTVELCFTVQDFAGNSIYPPACFAWPVCPADEDLCPPFVDIWMPPHMATLCPPDAPIWMRIIDPIGVPGGDCPICTGIDRTSLEIDLYNAGHIFTMFDGGGLLIESIGDCNIDVMLDNAYYMLTPGTGGTLCVEGADNAGNGFYDCIEFFVCDSPWVEDDCPPVFVNWLPAECLPVGGPFTVRVLDPEDSVECPITTGVDRDNFEVNLIIDDDTLDVTLECATSGWEYFGMQIDWMPIGWLLPNDTDVTVCVYIRDNAGNTANECHVYHTCAAPEDVCSPNIIEWHPAPGDTFCPPDAYIWFRVVDPIDSFECPICTGINIASVIVELITVEDSYALTDGAGLLHEPLGECGMDIALDPAYFELVPGNGVTLHVSGADNAGNEFYEHIFFFVCDTMPLDSCPPVVEWYVPPDGDTLFFDSGQWWAELATYIDSMFNVGFSDFGCPTSGINEASLIIQIAACGDSEYTVIDGYDAYCSWDYGNAWGSLDLLELEPDECYELCASIADNAGNWGHACVTFYTGSIDDSVDACPPEVVSWFPDADSCIPVDATLGLMMWDPLDAECLISSGIDTYSIAVTVEFGVVSPIDITTECEIVFDGDDVGITWYHSDSDLPEGEEVVICVEADDYAGNHMYDCFAWFTCGEEPVDNCPPVVVLEYPDTLFCLPPDSGTIMFNIWDPLYDTLCPIETGVDTSTIAITVDIGSEPVEDITDECDIISHFGMYSIIWHYDDLPEGETVIICIDGADYAGNWMYPPACYTWTTCSTPSDECPPQVSWISIYDGSVGVPVDAFIEVDLWDPIGTPECSLCTGIDTMSVTMTLIFDSDTIVFTILSSELHWISDECMFAAWLDSSFSMLYDTEYHLCIDAADNSGNEMPTYCVTFETESEIPGDHTPPCVEDYGPTDSIEAGSEILVWADICDICGSPDSVTGVDSASLYMFVNDDSIEVLEYLEIDCYGWAIFWHAGTLEAGEYFVDIGGSDHAGNTFSETWHFVIYETDVPVDIIEPLNDTWTACDDQSIVAVFTDGIASVPGDFTFTVNWGIYDFDSPEVTLSGDTLIYTSAAPWVDGTTNCFDIGTAHACFGVDLSPPVIEIIYPECDDTITDPLHEIVVQFHDDLSGLNEASLVVTIDAVPFTIEDPAVEWYPATGHFIVDLMEASISLEGEIEVCGMATDNPDYCTPNYTVSCCNFLYLPPLLFTIAGHIDDTLTGLPLDNAVVVAFSHIGAPAPPFIVFGVTDAAGYYSMIVPEGLWLVAAFHPIYPPVFWDGHPYPFDADPIELHSGSPDTFWADFDMGISFGTFFRFTGTVEDEYGTIISAAVIVAIATDDEGEELSISSDISDSMGNFDIPVAPGRNYYLLAYAEGFEQSFYGGEWGWGTGDSIAATADIDGLDFSIDHLPDEVGEYNVFGTIYKETDLVLDVDEFRGVMVCLCNLDTDAPMYCSCSEYDGDYTIEGVPDGTYKLIADRAHYVHQGEWDELTMPDTSPHDIYLRYWAAIDEHFKVPEKAILHDARPNPFNAATAIEFYIPDAGHATLDIVDVTGRTVTTLLDSDIKPGNYLSVWTPEELSSGIYFARLSYNGDITSIKLLLAK